MNTISKYRNFLKEKGRLMLEPDPTSKELALKIEDALKAIELLRDTQLVISGGDILTEFSGSLRYIYENWCCEKIEEEGRIDYVNRSHNIAEKYIRDIVKRGEKNRYVIFVI